MTLSVAVWLVILSALVMANLPFVLDRPLAAWGWAGSQGGGAGLRWLRCLVFLVGVALWSWGTLTLVGGAFAGGGSTAGLVFIKLLASVLILAGWLYWPGARAAGLVVSAPAAAPVPGSAAPAVRRPAVRPSASSVKPFIDRILEVLIGYVLVGTLGNALELNLGNSFTQGWEFYAVTLALFLVLGYPGFVWRYMLKRRSHH
ncbi:hypothetical protein CDEF62S_02609 [Castellaniella defragrans]